MKKRAKLFSYILIGVNAFCAVTEAVYYLTKADCVFFNLAAIVWFGAMLANMVACLCCRKSKAFRTIAMMAPCILTWLTGMLGNNASSPAMGIIIEILAFLYFTFSAFHAWYLFSDKYAVQQNKPAKNVGLFFYGLLFLVSLGMFIWFYVYTLIISELSMTSTVSMLSGFRIFLIVWMISASLGMARRLGTRGLNLLPKVIITAAGIMAIIALIPSVAAINSAENANKQYQRVFGGESGAFVYSVPEAVFGSTESGYTVLKDQEYMTMTFTTDSGEAKDYKLAFDLYTPTNAENPLPVLLRIHGSSAKKGVLNNTLASAALASEGYAVVDMNYGNESVKPGNDILAENLCVLLDYLYAHRESLNLDMDNVFLSGGSRGGKMVMKVCAAWANNTSLDLRHKITIRGGIVIWGMMNDVFERTGNERIISLEELSSDLPAMLFIDNTNDGSVQGGNLLEGVLYTLGVPATNIELRYGMHGADNHYYGFWGQLCDCYILRFMSDMVQ